ncbi:MAG: hypothetical protein O9308_13630 [Beijerinckiaceae bacterium]|nr:hypothetical protein [Beijerinckiaceae bacterium]
MDERYYGLIELLLFGALAIGFGVQQLWSLRKAKEKAAREKAAREAAGRGDPPA